jgi:hypothetical protein
MEIDGEFLRFLSHERRLRVMECDDECAIEFWVNHYRLSLIKVEEEDEKQFFV